MDDVKAPGDFCPYVGLQPYSEADQDYFFGRERDSRIISSNLYAAALTVLYGPSGVGKSSVLRAGVIPRLRASERTAVFIFDEWADQNLLNTLKTKCLEAIADIRGNKDIQFDFGLPLDEFLFSIAQTFDSTLVIIFDQFEEYFLYHSKKDSTFDAEFARAVNREDIDTNFLITLREDALSKLDRFRARIPNLLGNVLRLRHLDAASAQDAIRKPVEIYSNQHPTEPRISIEDELVEELINEIRVDKLMIGPGGRGVEDADVIADSEVRIEAPFLQLVLTRLWDEEMYQDSRVLHLATLNTLGGAGQVVRTHMDAAMNTLSHKEQEMAADIFRYMVTPSGTKIAYTVADLEYYVSPTRSLEPVLEKLAHGNVRIMRPVTSLGEPGVIRYEIYHDVLTPAVLDWRARFESGKQLLSLFDTLIDKGDLVGAFQVYQDILRRIPQQAFLPERYQLQEILGQSSLGVNYRVFDLEKNRFVIATILPDNYVVKEEDVAQFTSPHISRIWGFHQHHEYFYMLSEDVEGQYLQVRLRENNPLPYSDAMQIAGQIAEALEDSHGQGIPHLNLRPSNIMLNSEGVKLMVYEFSRLKPDNQISGKRAIGDPDDYLSPEQLAGKEGDERSDIYSLGTILYEMLSGQPPSLDSYQHISAVNFQATNAVDVLIKHAREHPPEKRFATAGEMHKEINRTQPESTINQYLRIGLAWLSERYKQFTSGRGLAFLLLGLVILLALSLTPSVQRNVRLLAGLLMPLLLNSLLVSFLFNWIIQAIARRRGLHSLNSSGSGMGAILGLVFTLNLIGLLGVEEIIKPGILSLEVVLLILVIFQVAFGLGIILAIAWITERLFKSYTTGFYWSFMAIVFVELVLTILGQPVGLLAPA